MKNLFKEAHKMTREIVNTYNDVDYKAQFSLCLVYLLENEEEGKVIELTGTEKQVAWAEKIREKLEKDAIKSLEKIKETTKRNGESRLLAKRTRRCEAVLNHIKTETDSKWFIKYSNSVAMAVGKELIGE